jgi:nucleotidyltransferase substrate binding protein (TIGR01987 family)
VTNEERKTVRWKQRFSNLEKAWLLFEEACTAEKLNRLEQEGLIQRFEYTWELSWNTLKDYLESQGLDVQYPRDTVKEAFATGLIRDGDVWMEMLGARNLVSHRYDETIFVELVNRIRTRFYPTLASMVREFQEKKINED